MQVVTTVFDVARGRKSFIEKYWGYGLLAAIAAAWWIVDDKGKVAPLLIAASVLTIIYFLSECLGPVEPKDAKEHAEITLKAFSSVATRSVSTSGRTLLAGWGGSGGVG